MEIASAFGPLKAYRFEFNDNLNEPCAFLEVRVYKTCLKFRDFFVINLRVGKTVKLALLKNMLAMICYYYYYFFNFGCIS